MIPATATAAEAASEMPVKFELISFNVLHSDFASSSPWDKTFSFHLRRKIQDIRLPQEECIIVLDQQEVCRLPIFQ
jgi:hypothetical protein